jgi:hypothetical protein
VKSYTITWLNGATHLGFLGVSIDREAAERDIDEIAKRARQGQTDYSINEDFARGGIVRAIQNAPAIYGGRILWVDDPTRNKLEISILGAIGVDVFQAKDTKEALTYLPIIRPDLIISNIVRDEDQPLPLKNCPAHYFQVPIGLTIGLNELNSETMAGSRKEGGFSMAEAISNLDTSRIEGGYTDHIQPRIIYYSATNAGRVANQCARLVTNRADLLLQTVVSSLEALRWRRLEGAKVETKKQPKP